MQKLNKKANSGTVALWILVVVVVLVAFGGVVYVATGTRQEAIGSPGQTTQSGTIVLTNPTPAVSVQDAQQAGTSVGNTLTVALKDANGNIGSFGAPASTAPGIGFVGLVTNGTTYHNTVVGVNADGTYNPIILTSSFTAPILKANKNATVTETMYYKQVALTNNGGANNITDLGNGVSYSITDEMQANALTNTQDMVCVVELTAGNNASTISPVMYAGKSPEARDISKWYTIAGVNSRTYVFTVAPLSNTNPVDNNLLVTADTSGRFTATSYILKSCFTKEWFTDSRTNLLTYDVADSAGTLKSMAVYKQKVYFQ